ncbi:hypothetical protein LVQ79_10680 [Buttiauxella sp. A2-C1_F]|uniref:hypothetical protein n=1 Tax=Buttiauxella sp. A2-C1_F TaxID=2904526 RepID=UPI001E3802BF|nr:hypothetical protein [Buttiauxella sp. A2-C1_F]MCE0846010.1 hypothetical protein [Buttiauxella sp. A2-C1_F]
MNTKLLVAALILPFSLSAQALEAPEIQGWTYLAGSKNFLEYAKEGSGKLVKGTRTMLVQLVPVDEAINQKVQYQKFTISDRDCKAGYGVIKLYALSGELLANVDYVQGGSSVSTVVADILCSIELK